MDAIAVEIEKRARTQISLIKIYFCRIYWWKDGMRKAKMN